MCCIVVVSNFLQIRSFLHNTCSLMIRWRLMISIVVLTLVEMSLSRGSGDELKVVWISFVVPNINEGVFQ